MVIQFMSAWRNVDAGKRCLNPDLVKTSRPNSVATRLECQAVRLSGELARCVANCARPKPENAGGIPVKVRILPRSNQFPRARAGSSRRCVEGSKLPDTLALSRATIRERAQRYTTRIKLLRRGIQFMSAWRNKTLWRAR